MEDSRLFFPDTLTDEVHESAPYGSRATKRDTRNSDRGTYNDGGTKARFALQNRGSGYYASIAAGVNGA